MGLETVQVPFEFTPGRTERRAGVGRHGPSVPAPPRAASRRWVPSSGRSGVSSAASATTWPEAGLASSCGKAARPSPGRSPRWQGGLGGRPERGAQPESVDVVLVTERPANRRPPPPNRSRSVGPLHIAPEGRRARQIWSSCAPPRDMRYTHTDAQPGGSRVIVFAHDGGGRGMFTEYTSTGTIKRLKVNRGDPVTELFFVPDCHHSVQHDDALYAVFIPFDGSSAPPEFDAVKVRKCHQKESCCIQVECPKLWLALSHAVANQCKVDVKIKVRHNGALLLVGATIPAKSAKSAK